MNILMKQRLFGQRSYFLVKIIKLIKSFVLKWNIVHVMIEYSKISFTVQLSYGYLSVHQKYCCKKLQTPVTVKNILNC